ncbi:MAG: DUF1841 family protein [Steroidobacteraceae bacterium]
MHRYYPEKEPDAAKWLALSEAERLDLATYAHRKERLNPGAITPHAALHVAVENQLAMGQPASVSQAMVRLRSQGLSRHDAVHAIASVLAEHLHAIVLADDVASKAVPKAYEDAVAMLDGNAWLESFRGDG